jgi:hypothetical protein
MKARSNRSAHWVALAIVVSVLAYTGLGRYHVREFATFTLVLLGLVTCVVAFVVRAYSVGEVITREPFEDAVLPHQARESDES